MMSALLNVLHPTFEALSAHADRGELDAARTRVGRHVSRCPQCQAVVAEIQQLGHAVRATETDGAPAHLWERIAAAAAEPREQTPRETPPPDATPWEAAPSLRPTRHWPIPARKTTRVGLGALVAAAAIIAMLVWPAGRGLQASAVSRLTFSPGRPAAGGLVTVQYQAAPWLNGASRLLLLGKVRTSAVDPIAPWWMRVLGDSLATLTPAGDGYYRGSFRVPRAALTLNLVVVDSAGNNLDSDGGSAWHLVAGRADGGPSFPALLIAASNRQDIGLAEANRPRQPYNPADSLRRYFPQHPAGYAYSEDYGKQKGVFTFLNYFQTAERKYLALWETLWPQRQLDGDVLSSMAAFAHRIEEPAEEMKWALRLVKEHPEDPRALDVLADALHEVELRQPKGLADTMRAWLPVLDALYRRTPRPVDDQYATRQIVIRYGDSATIKMWKARMDSSLMLNAHLGKHHSDETLRQMPASQAAEIVAASSAECRLPAARYPLLSSIQAWTRECAGARGVSLNSAARWRLLHGDPRGAIALAQSAASQMVVYNGCAASAAHRTAASGWLALGDTLRAEDELALMWNGFPPSAAWGDTVRAALGARFHASRFQAKVDSANAVINRCYVEKRAAAQAKRALYKARGQ